VSTLFRYRFGELAPPREKTVAAHLSICTACRQELHRLRTAPEDMATPQATDLQELLARVRGWEAGPSGAERKGEALKRRVAAELEPYLGKHAAQAILQPVVDDGGNLLSSLLPLLTMFLGCRATEHLVSSVVEHAIVRI
jgi:hypothetical protein